MNAITGKSFTRTLSATAVAAVLALSMGTSSYAADAKSEAATPPAAQPAPVQPAAAKPADAAKAATEQVTDRETVQEFAGWEDPNMARVAVHGGRAMLRYVQAAHAALEENKLGEARSDLNAAGDFAEGLQMMIPFTVVVDNIRNAKHELLSSSAGIIVDDMLPIYSSLDEMAEFAPELAKTAKSKLDLALSHAKKGEKEKAAEKMDEVAADISSTTVYLPVLYVEHQVAAARAALDKDPADTATAKTAVDNAQLSLVHATVNMHVFPEEKAAGKQAPSAAAPAAAVPKAG